MANKIKTVSRGSKLNLKRISKPGNNIFKKRSATMESISVVPDFMFVENTEKDDELHQQSLRMKSQAKADIDNSIKEKLFRLNEIDFDKKWEEQKPVKMHSDRFDSEIRISREKKKDKEVHEKNELQKEAILEIELNKINREEGHINKVMMVEPELDKISRKDEQITEIHQSEYGKSIPADSSEKMQHIKAVCAFIWEKIILFIEKCVKVPGELFSGIKVKARIYYREHPEKAKERRAKNKKLFRRIILFKRNVVAKERAAAEYMARMITGLDHRNEKMAEKTTKIVKRSNFKLMIAREYAEINKAKLLIHLVIFLIIATGLASCVSAVTAYEYSYNGRVLGVVKNQSDVLKLLDIVTVQLTKEYHTEVKIDKELDIVFDRVLSVNREIDSSEDVLQKLTYMQDMKAKAYAVYVNGNREVVVSSKEMAEELLENVKKRYLNTSGTSQYERIGFAEDVQIREFQTKLGRIQNSEDALQKILTGALENKVHIVQSGETFSGIAKRYGIKSADLRVSNPGITPEKLSIGQEIVLTQAVPLITVQTVEVATYIEPIAFEVVQQDTSAMYKGEKSVKVRGVAGERQVVARLTKNNGIEVLKTELKSDVIKEPVKEVVLIGIKPPPPLQGTGTYAYPVSGARITTYFSKSHPAVDLAISSGTKIRAADGGTVISAGYSGSYGYVIRINHGGNRTTLYAHCSKILVRSGEKVYQGQVIGNVGSTGRSTGPHLHFELIINGIKKNPLSYL